MQSLNDIFQSYPLCIVEQRLRKQQISESFSDYVDDDTFTPWHFALYKFATVPPLKYTRAETIHIALAFFNQNVELTSQALSHLQREISHAVFSLLRQGSSWSSEEKLALDNPKHILDFEHIWHPEYQRYCEHVFNHLIRIPLFILGTINNKDYQSPALANRVGILSNNGLAHLIEGYDSIVRNSISHGSVSFDVYEITYTDRNQSTSLSASEFAVLFESLVDTCHSILVSLLLFICENQTNIENNGISTLPLGLRFLFIDALASHTGLELLSMVESSVAGNDKQLNISCRIDSKARSVQLMEGMNVCWHSCIFGGDKYIRFSISFDCGMSVSPILFINGQRLLQAVKYNETLQQCQSDLVETALLWFDDSKLKQNIYKWRCIITPLWKTTKRKIVNDWRKMGLKIVYSTYAIRYVQNQSAGNVRRIEAHVIIKERGTISDTRIQEIVKHAVRRLRRYRVRGDSLYGKTGLSLTPQYIWIRFYTEDKRVRALLSSGWKEGNLVLRAEWFSRFRNRGAIFVKNPHSVVNRIRIEYNPNLIHQVD